MKQNLIPILGLALPLLLPLAGGGAELPPTTRQQTVRPLALSADTQQILLRAAAHYKLWLCG